MKVIELDPNSIEVVALDALTNFHSGIKSEETRKTMERNLSTFLNIVCKQILKGNLSERAQEFVELAQEAEALGFLGVMSGPLVRSSYRAGRLYKQALEKRAGVVHG